MLDRHAERLQQMKPRVLVGQFAGAAGTLASLGTRGMEVQKALMEELKLAQPVATWHAARDGLAEAVNRVVLDADRATAMGVAGRARAVRRG